MRMKIAATAIVAVALSAGAASAAGTPEQRCQQAKLKAYGRFQACLKMSAADVIGGDADSSAKCQARFIIAIDKADLKAASATPVAACRILDNNDGTLTDLNTGLMWEQKGGAGGGANLTDPHDVDNAYKWSSSGTAPDGSAFTDLLARLNGGTSSTGVMTTGCYAEHCDWRLPTVEELATIDTEDSAFQPDAGSFYLSQSVSADNAARVWVIRTDTRSASTISKLTFYYVRAVRSRS